MAVERLHKVMANAGIASRRECEAMIAAGRVSVNGKIVTEMGVKVDPERDQIRVDGEPIKARAHAKFVYLMLYKPAGYLSVFGDERGRPGLEALVKMDTRLYPVGRLDADSEGLQLLTNDGELTLRLSHPRYEHSKTYLVLVDRVPGSDTLANFRRGIELEDGKTLPSEWRVLEKPPHVAPPSDPSQAQGVWLQVTLREGRKRQIRRMAAAEKLVVRRLIRIGMGPLRLDRKLRPGQSRPLTGEELRLLTAVESVRSDRSSRRPAGGYAVETGRRPAPGQGPGAGRPRLSGEGEGERGRQPQQGRGPGAGRPRPSSEGASERGRRPAPGQGPGTGRPRPSGEGEGERGRQPQQGRGPGAGRPRPSSEGASERGRRPAPGQGPGAGRPRPSGEGDGERSRRPQQGRGPGAGRPRPSGEGDGERGRRPQQGRGPSAGRPRSSVDRNDEPGRRPAERGPEAGRARPPADRSYRSTQGEHSEGPDRRRAPSGRSEGSSQRPQYDRETGADRRDRQGHGADRSGPTSRSHSPLRFQKPSRQGDRTRTGGFDREGRGGRSQAKSRPDSSAGSRPPNQQRQPRSGGAPKKRKP